jgi:hypothetical protein
VGDRTAVPATSLAVADGSIHPTWSLQRHQPVLRVVYAGSGDPAAIAAADGRREPVRRLVPILAILLLAATTRIVNAGHWPVWTDEGWSTWAASDHHLDVILDKVSQDRHPPLYFLSLSAWWTVAGNSRIALRFLSIASGIRSTQPTPQDRAWHPVTPLSFEN